MKNPAMNTKKIILASLVFCIIPAGIAKAAITFSNIEVNAVRDTSVNIQWDTDVPATGQIEYGLNTSYGNLNSEEDLSYWHSMEITGLNRGAAYQYRIRAKDSDGNETISGNYSVKTLTLAELETIIKTAREDGHLPYVYYMKPTGDNGKDGLSLDTAWASLSHAQDRLKPGDTLLIAGGNYYNDTFVAQVSGIPEALITIKALNDKPAFIESGSGRTLNLFNFGDANEVPAPYPVFYYNVENIYAGNYRHVFTTYYESHHLNFTNIKTKDCRYAVHTHRGCHHVVMKDFKVENSYYAPFHFWYYNHHNKLENAEVTGIVHDHGLIDFHTDNDYITVNDVSFHGEMMCGEAIYFHGDYGTNDNNVLKDMAITMVVREDFVPDDIIPDECRNAYKTNYEQSISTKECLDIWSVGHNNYFENLALSHIGGKSNLIALGSGEPGSNFTIRNAYLKCSETGHSHGIYIEPASNIANMLIENVTIENVNYAGYRSDIVVHFPDRINEIIFRDIQGDHNNFRISSYDGMPNTEIFEFMDNRIFVEDFVVTNPRYYPDRSRISVEETGGDAKIITYYPMSVIPAAGYTTITVNEFDLSLPPGGILVDITVGEAASAAAGRVDFVLKELKSNSYYNIFKDDQLFASRATGAGQEIKFFHYVSAQRKFTISETDALVTGRISGRVTSRRGLPIEGAGISNGEHDVFADNNGCYALESRPIGEYELTASASGYLSSRKNVILTEQGISVDFTLGTAPGKGKAVVYPNPYISGQSAPGLVYFDALEENSCIRIYTLNGDLIATLKNKGAARKEWNISGVAGGIYLYYMDSPESKKRGKISIIK